MRSLLTASADYDNSYIGSTIGQVIIEKLSNLKDMVSREDVCKTKYLVHYAAILESHLIRPRSQNLIWPNLIRNFIFFRSDII